MAKAKSGLSKEGIKKLNKLEKLKKRKRELYNEEQGIIKEIMLLETSLSDEFQPKYKLNIHKEPEGFLAKLGAIRFTFTCTNRKEWDTLRINVKKKAKITLDSPIKVYQRSLAYFWIDGEIFSEGGGHCLLQDPEEGNTWGRKGMKATKEEWDQIRIGKIPSKFLPAAWLQRIDNMED